MLRKKLPKAIAAKQRLQQINSEITIDSLIADVHGLNIEEIIKGSFVILDATDNFETRMIVNDAAVKHGYSFYIWSMCCKLWTYFFNYSRKNSLFTLLNELIYLWMV